MRIVDVCAFYTPTGGGVRTYIDRKLAAGPAMGHDVVIIAPGATTRVEERGPRARVVWLESPLFPFDRNYRYFADEAELHAAISAADPDVLEASSPWRSASMAARWPGRKPVPRSLFMHSDPLAAFAYRWFEGVASPAVVDRGFDWYWRHLLRLDGQFDMVVSACNSLTARLEVGGLRRVVTNPMGIDPHVFAPTLRDEGLRAALLARCGLGPDATLLLGVGRHAPEKRWRMVVEAVMSAAYHRPIGLVIVGSGRDSARIRRTIGGNPHIHLAERTSDRAEMARFMASADALIHGSESETFCLVAAEARASGLPLITPDRGAAADHALASNGITYTSGDPVSAAAAIGRFVDLKRAGRLPAPSTEPVRTMDDHFAELFGAFAALIAATREPVAQAA
ncbi:MAG: glycosyltransferase [Sphingomonadaceae bacterium]|nr:glycosyltransferase [Sphingomonadaceae bacterium]